MRLPGTVRAYSCPRLARGIVASTIVALLTLPASADVSKTDDSDISGPVRPADVTVLEREARREGDRFVFALLESAGARKEAQPGTVGGTLLLADRDGGLLPARRARARLSGPGAPTAWVELGSDGRFSLAAAGLSGSFTVRFSLDNSIWAFRDSRGRATYEWESPAFQLPVSAGLDLGLLQPAPASQNAKLGVLHLTYLKAADFLERETGLSWWTKTLTVRWPGTSDYFSPFNFSLELTNAAAWDVNLHELGHAVMHAGLRASGGAGQHKIDECYSEGLAWSEGWATFFAGAVWLSADDPDAKFEYLVPRRAPIRLENVPEDVCKGPTNEWRVASGLWDLYDRHADGLDGVSLPFSRIWQAFASGPTRSMGTAWDLLAKSLSAGERLAGEDALRHNTLLAPRATLAVTLPADPAW